MDKPPILGLIQRGGQVVSHMLANVQQRTIKPVITQVIAPGSLVHTDEYAVYARLETWGYHSAVQRCWISRTGSDLQQVQFEVRLVTGERIPAPATV